MKKYLLVSIIATSLLFTACIIQRCVLVGFNLMNDFAEYSFYIIILGCVIACIVSLVFGIKGLKDKTFGGQTIATVVVSSIGTVAGSFIVLYYLIFIVLSTIVF